MKDKINRISLIAMLFFLMQIVMINIYTKLYHDYAALLICILLYVLYVVVENRKRTPVSWKISMLLRSFSFVAMFISIGAEGLSRNMKIEAFSMFKNSEVTSSLQHEVFLIYKAASDYGMIAIVVFCMALLLFIFSILLYSNG